ncbi:MAG TPA: phosphotransferase [Streptosporangiaceae bacterium]|nr:phosphotransferase [Streptosporangiaceae bacterium]
MDREAAVPDAGMDEPLAWWGRVEVVGPLGGGNRNSVLEIRIGQRRLAARRSRRSPASLDWEIALLDHLASHGLRVPAVVPARDGRRHIDGVVVQTWLDGTPPGDHDWPAVAVALRKVHALTSGWPQRPGFASTRELLTADRGGDVDLSKMPGSAVAACRSAWSALAGTPQAVVHGDPGPANIRVTDAGAGLLDWDEARVDYTDLDLAELPCSDLPRQRLAAARTAATAWEAANGWSIEPSYARGQLRLLQSGKDSFA